LIAVPNIVEYVNRETLTPSDRGTEARVQEGRRIGGVFNQVAESLRDFGNRVAQNIGSAVRDAGDVAVQYAEHREVNQGIDTYWQLRSKLENDWLDTVKGNPDKGIPPADVHDPAVAQQFMEQKLSPALQNWGDTFQTEGGRKFAQARISSFLDHMTEKTAADMGTVAAAQVEASVRRIFNTASNIAYNDPSATPHLIEDVKASVAGMVNSSPHLKGATAAKATNELTEKGIETVVKSGMSGGIQKVKDPEAEAQKWITDPRYSKYINGPEAAQFAKYAKVQAKTNDLTDKQAAAFKRQQNDDAVKAQSADVMNRNVSVDPATGRVTINPKYFPAALDIARKNPDAPNAASVTQALINWGQHQQTAEARETVISDPAVKSDLYDRIFSADKPTTNVDIWKAEVEGKLGRYDAQNLLNLNKAVEEKPLTGPLWHGIMDAVKGQLGNDPVGHEKFGQFVSAFIPEYLRLSRSNTLPPDALDTRNPNSMISKMMAPFVRSPMQMMRDRITHGYAMPGDVQGIQKDTGVTPDILSPTGIKIQAAAISKLQADKSPDRRVNFDKIFGKGAADMILGPEK
jgi:hypothetical protein